MRAMWKGAVSFGLVTVPVRLYSATESHDVSFHQVRATDGSRIRYRRIAEADGEEVAYRDIAKGYVTADGRTVVLTDEDLAALPNRSSKEIAVEKFVPADQIDPMLLDRCYYLEPDATTVKAYALLREALRESDRMAVVTISMRTRQTIAVLRVREETIVLQTMLWPDEIRAADFEVLDDVPEPKESERQMARMLVDSMAGDFDPDDYADDYRDAVDKLVQAKLEGGDVIEQAPQETDSGEVVDLLAALQKSVERAKAARGGSSAPAGEAEAAGDEAAGDEAAGDEDPAAEAASGAPPARRGASKKATKTSSTRTAPSKRSGQSKQTAPSEETAPAKKAPAKKTAPKRKAS